MILRLFLFVNDHRKWFIGSAIALLLLLLFVPFTLYLYNRRIMYDWHHVRNFGNKESEAPYGAKYYDEHLKNIWTGKIIYEYDLSHAYEKYDKQRCNYLMFVDLWNFHGSMHETKEELFVHSLEKGNNYVFCNLFSFASTLLALHDNYPNLFYIDQFRDNERHSKILLRLDDKNINGPDTARIWSALVYDRIVFEKDNNIYSEDVIDFDTLYDKRYLTTSKKDFYHAIQRRVGPGKVLINAMPILYTNYAVSRPDLLNLSDKMLLQTFDKSLPLVVIYDNSNWFNKSGDDYKAENIFTVMFKHPATKVAMYCLLTMMLLAIIVNSRRRRCPETPLNVVNNSSINYIRHVATLYKANSDYTELLEIEQRKILYNLRKEYCFDITTHGFTMPSEFSDIIAKSKGINAEDVRDALTTLEELSLGKGSVSRKAYMACLAILSKTLYTTDNNNKK